MTQHDLTIGEAEAAEAMRDRCAAVLLGMAANLRTMILSDELPSTNVVRTNIAVLEQAAEVVAMLEPRQAVTGLCYRGG